MVGFRLLGIPVGVHATFLFVALLGATAYRGWDIAWWTVAAFASILLHEMGHALTARAYGASGISVTLYGLGGVTTFSHDRGLGHGRSFVISAAGSFVGIVAGGAVFVLANAGVFDGSSRAVVVLVNSFVFTALVWGVLNWIPIVPLDGGHMVQHLVSIFDEERAPLIGQVITWVTLAIIVPLAWINGYRFAVFIAVFFAIAGYREYRDEMDRRAALRRHEDPTDRDDDDGPITPDEVMPAPPSAPPSGPPPGRFDPRASDGAPRPSRRDPSGGQPPEFPI
jgi:Zn-dependent protease